MTKLLITRRHIDRIFEATYKKETIDFVAALINIPPTFLHEYIQAGEKFSNELSSVLADSGFLSIDIFEWGEEFDETKEDVKQVFFDENSCTEITYKNAKQWDEYLEKERRKYIEHYLYQEEWSILNKLSLHVDDETETNIKLCIMCYKTYRRGLAAAGLEYMSQVKYYSKGAKNVGLAVQRLAKHSPKDFAESIKTQNVVQIGHIDLFNEIAKVQKQRIETKDANPNLIETSKDTIIDI